MFCAVIFFDIIMVVFAGIPSYALHTCLEIVVPNGTFLRWKLKVENWKLTFHFQFSIFNSLNPCRLGEIALRNFVVEWLRQKYCLSEASLFLSSEDDKILADLSAAASFFCFSFLREKREKNIDCR